tara:strand:- start:11 stop:538 length:528 start_codon:yes stop_codon:yes gene_type:complete
MAYIYAGPGSANKVTLTVKVASNGSDTGLSIPALQDVTIEAANDVFSFSSLESNSVTQVATVASNSISGNIVVDSDKFFGTTAAVTGTDSHIDYADASVDTAVEFGIFGLSSQKVRVSFELYMGSDTDAGASVNEPTIKGAGYVTGLSPNISADSPVWITSFSIVGDQDLTVVRA